MKRKTIILIFLFGTIISFGQTEIHLLKTGIRQQNADSCKEAIINFSKAILTDPDCYKCYEQRGHCKYSLKDYDGAIGDFYKALEVEKNDFHRHLYCLQYIAGYPQQRVDLAVKILDSLISKNPIIPYFERRAEYLNEIDNFEAALNDYNYIYKNTENPDYSLYWSIAWCNSELGNYFEAIQNYNKVVEMLLPIYAKDPKFLKLDKAYMNRGNCKFELKDYRGALKDYKEAILVCSASPYPTLSDLYNCQGKAETCLKDYQTALATFNNALDVNNGNIYTMDRGKVVKSNSSATETYYLRGIVYFFLEQKDKACEDWSIAGELGTRNAYTYIQEHCND